MPPTVSVVMSVFNGERYLQESIQSILSQTYQDFEFIIIDDCSSDGTPDIVATYLNQDQRIFTLRNSENIGLTRSLNKGLSIAHGRYVARQDADDVSLPFRFEKQVAVLNKESGVILVSGNINLIESDGRVWREPRRRSDFGVAEWLLLFYNYLGGHSQVMFRRQPVMDQGGYSENHKFSQDYELWSRLSELGRIRILPDVVLNYRRHEGSISSQYSDMQHDYSLKTSKRALIRLLGEQIKMEEVAELRAFWLGPLPKSDAVVRLNRRLSELYHAFLYKQATMSGTDPSLSHTLRRTIARRFLTWGHVLALQGKSRPMFLALAFSLKWFLFDNARQESQTSAL